MSPWTGLVTVTPPLWYCDLVTPFRMRYLSRGGVFDELAIKGRVAAESWIGDSVSCACGVTACGVNRVVLIVIVLRLAEPIITLVPLTAVISTLSSPEPSRCGVTS